MPFETSPETTSPARPLSVLRVDASPLAEGSVSRALSDDILAALSSGGPIAVTTRDLAKTPAPPVTASFLSALGTDPGARTEAQRKVVAASDELIAEVRAADVLVIGLPVHNFGPPSALKCWIDMIARARETFRYTETGPVGLLTGRRAIIAMASGGVEAGSAADFASPWLRQVLGFMGITEVTLVAADQVVVKGEASVTAVRESIPGLIASVSRAPAPQAA